VNEWWQGAVGYEVYLPSFADADGDGLGDLRGLEGRLDYLAWLGVDVVWVTPFYPSPMRDHGYDVADYRDVDPAFGSLTDVDRLVEKAHRLGMRLLVDLVPNHTSSDHPWFRQARSSRHNPYRGYYLWRDPPAAGGPPNNWKAAFGGDAWSWDAGTGQYWAHLFLPEQPDLNWANPAVAEEFDEILAFWLARGVDGFRVDVAHALAKHPELPDNPLSEPAVEPVDEPDVHEGDTGLTRTARVPRYDIDQPGVHEIYARWRRLTEPAEALLLGEVYLLDPQRLAAYVAGDGLDLAFWFPPLHMGWSPDNVRTALAEAAAAGYERLAWVLGSHDRPRAATRYGGGRIGVARALAMATLQMGMPGTAFVYQGEELGLEDVAVPPDQAADPVGTRYGDYAHARDGARTPMPWSPEPGMGFTDAVRPWLLLGDRTAEETMTVQCADPASVLSRYRSLIAARKALPPGDSAIEWLDGVEPIVAYRRAGALVVANCGDAPAELTGAETEARVLFATDPAREGEQASQRLRLSPCEALITAPD
jgi:alpha-glucosidase